MGSSHGLRAALPDPLLFVLAVLCIGAAAVLLVGPSATGPLGTGGAASGVSVNLPPAVWALFFLAPLLVGCSVLFLTWNRASPAGLPEALRSEAPPGGARESYPLRWAPALVVVVVIAVVLAAIVFLAPWGNGSLEFRSPGARSAGGNGGAASTGSTTGSGGNQTGNSSNGSGGNSTNPGGSGGGNTTNSSGGGGGHGNVSGGSGGSSNGTGSGGTGGTGTGSGNGTGNSTPVTTRANPPPPRFNFDLPPWAVVVAAIVLCGTVGLLALPGVLARIFDRRESREERRARERARAAADLTGIQRALSEAEASMDQGDNARDAIVRLYVRMLEGLSPRVGDLSSSTAEEIGEGHLKRLGVGATASDELTRLFETARYSSHALGDEVASGFRATIRAAERDLAQGGTAG